jgi:hypothetical protein
MEQVQRSSRSTNAENQARHRKGVVERLDGLTARVDELVVAVNALAAKNRELERAAQQREPRR